MTIEFPNLSRRYDTTQRCVRFSGYDGALEKSFFLEEQAIWRLDRLSRDNVEAMLDAFDRNRERIYKVATKIYAKYGGSSFIIEVDDFSD